MGQWNQTFDLKLLTDSRDVGLRRLRSYTASLGGRAQIFHGFSDLHRSMDCSAGANNVVLYDSSLPLTQDELAFLHEHSKVFLLESPSHLDFPTHGDSSIYWRLTSYMRCSLETLLGSQVIRMSMAQICRSDQPFQVQGLLRWGYAHRKWNSEEDRCVSQAGLDFIRYLRLVGEQRRLTEMFAHFVQAKLPELNLEVGSVVFGSDGLLLAVIAQVRTEGRLDLSQTFFELAIHSFPIAIFNHLGGGNYEIAALHDPFPRGSGGERLVLVFNKGNFVEHRTADSDHLEKVG